MKKHYFLIAILVCALMTTGCLNRSSDSDSSSTSGVSTISGNISGSGLETAPAHAPAFGNSVVGVRIEAVSSSSTVSATFNPSANTFMLSNIVEETDYTLNIYVGTKTYKAKVKIPSGKQVFLTDVQSVTGATGKMQANVVFADKTNPGTSPKICGCRFDTTGNVSEIDANNTGTWTTEGQDLYTTYSSKFVELTSTYTSFSTILTNLTLALSEGYDSTSSTLTDLDSVSRSSGTAPEFSVVYAKSSSATTNESLVQGDTVYVTVTLSSTPASTDSFTLAVLMEVLDNSGNVTKSQYHSRDITFDSSNKYTISTTQIAQDSSGKSSWSTFKESGQIRATLTVYNKTTKIWKTQSQTITVASRTPAAPTFSVAVSGTTATVTWTKPTTDELGTSLTSNTYAGITGYKIYRCASDGSGEELVGTVTNADTLTYADTSYISSKPAYKVVSYYTYSSYDYAVLLSKITAKTGS